MGSRRASLASGSNKQTGSTWQPPHLLYPLAACTWLDCQVQPADLAKAPGLPRGQQHQHLLRLASRTAGWWG